ncbi:hypothetical protein SDC9_175134 [bioreactor metagenome]|uniref:Uncharacterized protein n=1 Tax=bioreactor metagenome TaxID=1076179 RepID=A0A645GNE6_9ZZZZ
MYQRRFRRLKVPAPGAGVAGRHARAGALAHIAQQRRLRGRIEAGEEPQRNVRVVLRLVHQNMAHGLVRRGKAQPHH